MLKGANEEAFGGNKGCEMKEQQIITDTHNHISKWKSTSKR